MSKNNKEIEEYTLLFKNLLKYRFAKKFPYSFPLMIQGMEIGNIKISFDRNEKIKPLKSVEEIVNLELKAIMLMIEFDEIISLFKKDIELVENIINKFRYKIFELLDLLKFLDVFEQDALFVYYQFLFDFKEEEIFDLIKSVGPIGLRNSVVQNIINRWLSDKKTFGVKLNKLKDSLLEYGLGASPKDIPFKVGRPRKSILTMVNSKSVVNRYRDLAELLRIAKTYKDKYKGDIRTVIVNAEKELIFSKKGDPEWKERFEKSLKNKNYEFFHLISDCIEKDNSLKKLFESFMWEPNGLAKKILSKLFGVSESTLDNYMSQNK